MSDRPVVPESFAIPGGLTTEAFRLEPLGPQHNAADYAAWTSSIEHIRRTPGFAGRSWPHEMTLDENLSDLQGHAADFAERRGFTYTVLSSDTSEVIGCVYIYSPHDEGSNESVGKGRDRVAHDASVRSWVRADRAELDQLLYVAVSAWLERDWPFQSVDYAPRS